jgi:hypothetical protein
MCHRNESTKECLYLPRTFDLFEMEDIARLLHREDDSELDPNEEGCVELVEKLDELIRDWTSERKKELVAMLPSDTSSGNIPTTPNTDHETTEVDDRLQLATSIFQCAFDSCLTTAANVHRSVSSVLVGWDGVVMHGCSEKNELSWAVPAKTIIKYSERGSTAILSILSLFGLDPRTTTITDLDRLDVILTCSHCPPIRFEWIDKLCRPAMSWKMAVSCLFSS